MYSTDERLYINQNKRLGHFFSAFCEECQMRLFFALVPPNVIRQQLLLAMGGVTGARWQADKQLHLTVRYVGEVNMQTADLLMAETDRAVFPAITARLDGTGFFARRGKVEQLWAGISPKEDLVQVHKRIDRICVVAGLEPETRKYTPHITLARLSQSAGLCTRFLQDNAGMTSVPFAFERLVLMQSHLSAKGSIYVPLAEWNLGQMRCG